MKVSFRVKILLLSLAFSLTAVSAWSLNCTVGKVTFARRQFVRLSSDFSPETIQKYEVQPSECFGLCEADRQCSGYFVDHRNHSCLVIRNAEPSFVESKLVKEEASSYHKKICLPDVDCAHEWAFDVIPNVQLFRYDDKSVSDVTTVDHCMALCSREPTFECRSSRFDSHRHLCVLSRHNRRTAPEVFRPAPDTDNVVYLEKQCVQEPSSCLFRARQSRTMFRHQHVHFTKHTRSREDCEQKCLYHNSFTCRSYQFLNLEDSPDPEETLCVLSPEDTSTLHPATSLSPVRVDQENTDIARTNESFYEKESCIESEIRCEASAMSVVVRVSTPFRGRVYAAGHPYECYSVSVSDDGHITLTLPLHGRQCSTRNLGNGTFLNSVVVQHHPFVLKKTDRRIDVACDYEEMRLKIRGSKGVKDGELRPLSQTVTGVAPTPPIRLRVVNASNQEVSGVELGDPLFLKVELADESVYGIFGSDLVARSSGGSETVQLINDNGCPVEPTVISALEKVPGSKTLVAPFQAFKFASDSAVKFQMTVSYCLDTCPPVDCELSTAQPNNQRSYGKRKRRATSSAGNGFTDFRSGDVIADVTTESALFRVMSLGPAWEADQARHHRLQQLQFLELPEGHIRIRAPQSGLCVSSTTLYISAGVVGAFQLAIICACAVLFFRRGGSYVTSGTWSTASGRRKLVCNKS